MIATEQNRTSKGATSPSSQQDGTFLKFSDLDDQRVVVIHTGEQANRDAGARATLQRAHNEAVATDNPIDPEVEPEQTLYVKSAQLDEGGKLYKMADRDATKRVIVHQYGNLPAEKAKRLIATLRQQAPEAEIYRGKYGQNAEPWQLVDMVAYEQDLTSTSSLLQKEGPAPMIDKMSASQRAELLMEQLGLVAVHVESERVYRYNDSQWDALTDNELGRAMAATFTKHGCDGYSERGIASVVATMKLMLPEMGNPSPALIGFANGVYDMEAGHFRPHSPADGLVNHNGIHYGEPVAMETIEQHAPNFTKWLTHGAGGDAAKMERIKAALFMVLANRYDWQLFLEVTGEGGSGKSVFANIAGLLAGGPRNTGSGNMAALDSARSRYQFIDKRLILLPDQPRYVGDASGIKAITGGDMVEIDGKYEKQFAAVIRAVVLATNNEPMIITERNGGAARRRVIFTFGNVVTEAERDPDMSAKIAAELPVIIRHLLALFVADPEQARKLLLEQRDSEDALRVKRATDPVVDLCAVLAFLEEPQGMFMGGNPDIKREPRRLLYHLYLAYMEYHGLGRPLSVQAFTRALRAAAKEYGARYASRTVKGKAQTNVEPTESADAFMPQAVHVEPE